MEQDYELDPVALLLARAEALLLADRPQAALDLLLAEQVINTSADTAIALVLRGRACAALGDWNLAKSLAHRALNLEPQELTRQWALLLEGAAFDKVGLPHKGLLRFEVACARDDKPGADLAWEDRPLALRRLLADYELLGQADEIARLTPKLDGLLQDRLGGLTRRLGQTAVAALDAGDLATAGVALAQARAVQAVGEELLLAAQLRLVGWGQPIMSNAADASNNLMEARLLAQLAGDQELEAAACQRYGELALAQGLVKEAGVWAAEAIKAGPVSRAALAARLTLAEVAAKEQQFAEADALFESALELAESRGDSRLLVQGAWAFANSLRQRGEPLRAGPYYALASQHSVMAGAS